MSNLVKLIVNSNIGKKGDLVPDPLGNLVANRMAIAIGDHVEETLTEEVTDGPAESEVESDETSEGEGQSDAVEVKTTKNFKRKD